MTKHLVLILAYHFPPENAVGGARPYRFAKYLSRFGYECRVFTAANQSGQDDPNTKYVPDPFVTLPRHSLKYQLERAARKCFFPGEVALQWSYHASRAVSACIRAHPGARVTILSTFPPLGTLLAGWQLARSKRLTWIADCRDPLVEERWISDLMPFHSRLLRWMEATVAQKADAVILNTDAALIGWQEKFPSCSKKFHLIWNGFDPEERIKPLPVLSQDCKTLVHVGALYVGRHATPILESVARLITANRFPKGAVRIRLIGPAQEDCLPSPELIRRGIAEGWLNMVTEQVPNQEALQVARSSNGLLLLQPQSATQVPGKLFEYLQIGRPILAFIQPDSPAERLLERSGVHYKCVYPETSPETVDNAVASFFDLPSAAVGPSPWFEENFNAERQTRVLDALIRSLHGEMPRHKVSAPILDPRTAIRL